MRPSVIVVTLGMLAACGGLTYMHATRDEPEEATNVATAQRSGNEQVLAAAPAQAATTAENASTASENAATAPASSNVTDTASALARPDTVEQWIKDTRDDDPKIRAAAITKLANAPQAQALPVLKGVLESGDPEVDRHIALNSLHTLALRDGDKDGRVRNVMRLAIYDSDDDGVTQTAQSLLDDVEAALAEQQPQP